MKAIKIIIAGGGTGGHIFPGIALADHLISMNSKTKIIFLGSKTSLEKKIFEKTEYEHHSISTLGIRNNHSLLKILLQVPLSMLEAKKILANFKPDIVLSVGGYTAGPVGIMSKIKKIPLLVSEQNISPGITNQLLSKIADRIYTSFKKTRGLKLNNKIVFSGNPLRQTILNISNLKAKKKLQIKSTPFLPS